MSYDNYYSHDTDSLTYDTMTEFAVNWPTVIY